MPRDVFISHSSEDFKFAKAICDSLERAGMSCWIAPRDVPYNVPWPEAIVNAIEESRASLFLVSSNSLGSIMVERELVLSAKKPILPVRIENVTIRGSAQFIFAGCQWFDAFGGCLDELAEKKLIEAAREALVSRGLGDFQNPGASATIETDLQSPPIKALSPSHSWMGHEDAIADLATCPGKLWLASCGWDTEIRLWDQGRFTKTGRLLGHKGTANYPCVVHCLAVGSMSGNLYSGGFDGTIRIWHLGGAHPTTTLSDSGVSIYSLALSPDETIVVSGDADKKVRVRDAESGEVRHVLPGHSSVVRALAISSDGSTLFSGANDGVRAWDLETGKVSMKFPAKGSAFSIVLSPDSSVMAVGGLDGKIRVYEPLTGVLGKEFEAHQDVVRTLALSRDGSYLLSGSSDRTAKLWHLPSRDRPLATPEHESSVTKVIFDSDEKRFFTASSEGQISVWSMLESA